MLQPCPLNRPAQLICVGYRYPECAVSQWIEHFDSQVNTAYAEVHQMTVMGDFNIDVLKNSSDSQSWLESMNDLHLYSLHLIAISNYSRCVNLLQLSIKSL